MAIVPIDIPAGMMRNGTSYSSRGRWEDGNLIRWHDGSLRPIGGWAQRTTDAGAVITIPIDLATEAVRDSLSFRLNNGGRNAGFFSNSAAYVMNESGAVADITPVGYFQGSKGPSNLTGYGIGAYGAESYGTARSIGSSQTLPADRAYVDMWGENMLFGMRRNGPIYEYVPAAPTGVVLANAPTDVQDMIVTDQRIVMAITNKPEIRTIIWSDRENNTEWTPAVTNLAGSRILQGDGILLGLYKVLNQILILSETDAHIGRYLGAPFVYGFERVGANCDPWAADAVAKTDRFAVWWGKRNFWLYDGTLKPLHCDVMDFLVNDLNRDQVSKMHTTTVSDFSEIWWFYQSQSSTTDEVDSYVVWDYTENHWATGKIARTAAFDNGVYENSIYVDVSGKVWNHELIGVQPEGEAFALTGPLELSNGQRNMAVRYVLPDTQLPNEVELEFYTRQMPTDNDVMHGPFTYNNPISTTGVLGREVRMRAKGVAGQWELGTMRFDVQEVGGGFR